MLREYTMDDWSVSSPKNGVTEQGRRIGEYSALPADEKRHSLSAHQQDERTTPRRGYMAPRQYRLKKKGHVEYRLRNVRTKKLTILIIDIVDFKPHCWNLIHWCEKSHPYINFYQARPHMYSIKYRNEEYGI